MRKKFLTLKNIRKGFTLTELLIVIGIIIVLMFLIYLSYIQILKKSRDTRRVEDLKSIRLGLLAYQAENNTFPSETEFSNIIEPTYVRDIPDDPQTQEPYDYQALPEGCDNLTPATLCTSYVMTSPFEAKDSTFYVTTPESSGETANPSTVVVTTAPTPTARPTTTGVPTTTAVPTRTPTPSPTGFFATATPTRTPTPLQLCTPTLLTPSNNSQSTTVPINFTWQACSGQRYYEIDISTITTMANGSTVPSTYRNIVSGTGTSAGTQVAGSTQSRHTWRVRVCADTTCTGAGPWTAPATVIYQNTLSCTPQTQTPSSNQTVYSGSVTFVWSSCASVPYYRIRAWNRTTNAVVWTSTIVPTTYGNSSYQFTPGSYSWQVQSCSNSTCTVSSNWSTAVPFTVIQRPTSTPTPTRVPTPILNTSCVPSLSSPANNAVLPGSRVTLSWTHCTGASSYSININGGGGSRAITTGGQNSSVVVDLTTVGTYTWTVRACRSSSSCNASSPSRTFYRGAAPTATRTPTPTARPTATPTRRPTATPTPGLNPACLPTLNAPSSNAIVPPGTVNLSWNACPGATKYSITVSGSRVQVGIPSWTSTSYGVNASFQLGQQYRWSIKACNATSCNTGSSSRYFTYGTLPPTATPTPIQYPDYVVRNISRTTTNYNFQVCNIGSGRSPAGETVNFYFNYKGSSTLSNTSINPPAPGACVNVTDGFTCSDRISYQYDAHACKYAVTLGYTASVGPAYLGGVERMSGNNTTTTTFSSLLPVPTFYHSTDIGPRLEIFMNGRRCSEGLRDLVHVYNASNAYDYGLLRNYSDPAYSPSVYISCYDQPWNGYNGAWLRFFGVKPYFRSRGLPQQVFITIPGITGRSGVVDLGTIQNYY